MTALIANKKITSTAIVALLALAIGGTSMTTEAHAGKRAGWIAGGVAAGIVTGAIIARERRRHREVRRYSSWERHVDRCYRAYRSYDEETDTYIDYNGFERRCRK